MSQVYNLEPPTKGKVRNWVTQRHQNHPSINSEHPFAEKVFQDSIIFVRRFIPQQRFEHMQVIMKTSLGGIDIELWPKEAPKVTSRCECCCLEICLMIGTI